MWPWQRRRSIPDLLWQQALLASGLADLPPTIQGRLRDRAAEFLACKSFEAAGGLELTDAMALTIAAQACLPVLELGLACYDDWTEVVVYPSGFQVPRRITDDAGVVHEFWDELAGEAWPRGSLILAWDEVAASSHRQGSVVVHEFAHALDLANGEADGYPIGLAAEQIESWDRGFEHAWNSLVDGVEQVYSQLPADLDPESEAAERYFEHLPLDPYALTDEAEFLAVSVEAFFYRPERLRGHWPQWYAALAQWLRLDWAAIKPPR